MYYIFFKALKIFMALMVLSKKYVKKHIFIHFDHQG